MNDVIETTGREITDARGAELLAREINTIKAQTMRTVLLASIEIGEKLTEAKALVAHGEWENWLAENVDYSQSTANNLMKIYREYGDSQYDLFSTKPKSEIFGELTYSQAVALFALPAHEREGFVESHDMSSMSTRDVEDEIKRLKEEKELAERAAEKAEAALSKAQADMKSLSGAEEDFKRVESELENTKGDLESAKGDLEMAEQKVLAERARADAAEKALEELKAITTEASTPKQVTIDDVPEEDVAKLRAEITSKLEAEYAERAKADADKLKEQKSAEKEKAANREARIKELEADVARLDERAKKGESGAAVQQFAALFEAFQEDFNRMLSKLSALEVSDSETGAKIRAALGKVVGSMADKVGG